MKSDARNAIVVASVAALLWSSPQLAWAQNLRADLRGYTEVPAVSTHASGAFSATVDERTGTISYELRYDRLQGTAQMAQIHFGQPGVSGGVSIFLCSNVDGSPSGTQTCPTSGGAISGTLRVTDVIGPEAQGIAANEIDQVVRALRMGMMYVNVHSTRFPDGEIRGQIHWLETTGAR